MLFSVWWFFGGGGVGVSIDQTATEVKKKITAYNS